MSKKLDAEAMQKELAGLAFFQSQASPQKPASPTRPKAAPKPTNVRKATTFRVKRASAVPGENQAVKRQAVQDPSNHDAMIPRFHDTMTPSLSGAITKAVWEIGKEAATHRFTLEEKSALADIEYTYRRQGIRTCENEVTRIAINWIIEDYRANGENSVLHRMLKALHHKP